MPRPNHRLSPDNPYFTPEPGFSNHPDFRYILPPPFPPRPIYKHPYAAYEPYHRSLFTDTEPSSNHWPSLPPGIPATGPLLTEKSIDETADFINGRPMTVDQQRRWNPEWVTPSRRVTVNVLRQGRDFDYVLPRRSASNPVVRDSRRTGSEFRPNPLAREFVPRVPRVPRCVTWRPGREDYDQFFGDY